MAKFTIVKSVIVVVGKKKNKNPEFPIGKSLGIKRKVFATCVVLSHCIPHK